MPMTCSGRGSNRRLTCVTLAQLAARMPWADLESTLAITLPPAPGAGGRPALPVRLMAGLLYLKHAYNLSDDDVCVRWLENPYWQFFTGEVFFQTRLPCDPSSLTRWRQRRKRLPTSPSP